MWYILFLYMSPVNNTITSEVRVDSTRLATCEIHTKLFCWHMIYIMIFYDYLILFLLYLFTPMKNVPTTNSSTKVFTPILFSVSLIYLSIKYLPQISFYVAHALCL